MQSQTWLLAAGLVFTGVAMAYQGPKAEYSADFSMETAEGVVTGRLYSAKNKERREFVEDGEKNIMIIRHDKKVVWMVQPEERSYLEIRFPKEGRKDDISDWKVEQTQVGPDTVNGVKATKSKIIMTNPKGEKLGGFWWTSKDDIVVKMDAISVDKNSKERIKSELKNLKTGKQEASLFEVPAGYSKTSMGKMMMGGGKDDDDKPASPDKGGKGGGFGLKDALDLLK